MLKTLIIFMPTLFLFLSCEENRTGCRDIYVLSMQNEQCYALPTGDCAAYSYVDYQSPNNTNNLRHLTKCKVTDDATLIVNWESNFTFKDPEGWETCDYTLSSGPCYNCCIISE